ncbi:hypothetical protein IHE45_12G016400 [Dioscorea alata]|uniref:Uncharacterized protein n=1 Tax=Dioscorea alata TaxID=55571 RepID=A0ACB7V0A5_DIOAL|nr:hypothetical protein IHE45_12G016400 [Dioscorea alata]
MAGRQILNKIFLFVVLEGVIVRGCDFSSPGFSPSSCVCVCFFPVLCLCESLCLYVHVLTSSPITALHRLWHFTDYGMIITYIYGGF